MFQKSRPNVWNGTHFCTVHNDVFVHTYSQFDVRTYVEQNSPDRIWKRRRLLKHPHTHTHSSTLTGTGQLPVQEDKTPLPLVSPGNTPQMHMSSASNLNHRSANSRSAVQTHLYLSPPSGCQGDNAGLITHRCTCLFWISVLILKQDFFKLFRIYMVDVGKVSAKAVLLPFPFARRLRVSLTDVCLKSSLQLHSCV